MSKKKVNKKKDTREKMSATRVARFVLVLMVMFASVVTIEIITVVQMSKADTDAILSLDKVPVNYIKYMDNGRTFKQLEVSSDRTFIKYGCEAGCNLKVDAYGEEYKYLLEKNSKGEYLLSIVNDDVYVTYKENIGVSLRQAYFTIYKSYLTFVTVVDKDDLEYDHVIMIDNKNTVDKFTSLNANEMEFTDEGISYYYDNCITDMSLTNAELIRAQRLPFSKDVKVLQSSYINFDWCNVEEE